MARIRIKQRQKKNQLEKKGEGVLRGRGGTGVAYDYQASQEEDPIRRKKGL